MAWLMPLESQCLPNYVCGYYSFSPEAAPVISTTPGNNDILQGSTFQREINTRREMLLMVREVEIEACEQPSNAYQCHIFPYL